MKLPPFISFCFGLMCGNLMYVVENWHCEMPPGYVLQTDGYNYRFIMFENGGFYTNYDGGTKKSSRAEAWKLYRANKYNHHEWTDVK